MSKPKDSGWEYYVPEYGEDATAANPIMVWSWQKIYDADDAARRAAELDWSERDGWERGMGEGPEIVVISPEGQETRFSVEREADINHSVTELDGAEE